MYIDTIRIRTPGVYRHTLLCRRKQGEGKGRGRYRDRRRGLGERLKLFVCLAGTSRRIVRPKLPEIQTRAARRGRGGGQELGPLDDLVDDLDERPPHVLARLGADLAEPGPLRVRVRLALLGRDGAAAGGHLVQFAPDLCKKLAIALPSLSHWVGIGVIRYQINYGVRGGVGPRLLDPLVHAEEALLVGYVVDYDDGVGASVVTS